jgi:hypothetical protein
MNRVVKFMYYIKLSKQIPTFWIERDMYYYNDNVWAYNEEYQKIRTTRLSEKT